jgi:hypothetical protein
MNKKCTKCKVEKPLTEFYKRPDRGPNAVRSKCKKCSNKSVSSWKNKNPEKTKATAKKCQKRTMPHILRYQAEYRKKNRDRVNRLSRSRCARRHASKMQRTPAWSETREIAWFYEHCPEGMEVDHKYPLQGETVSGLHCFANLQYLAMSDNRSKGNRV